MFNGKPRSMEIYLKLQNDIKIGEKINVIYKKENLEGIITNMFSYELKEFNYIFDYITNEQI